MPRKAKKPTATVTNERTLDVHPDDQLNGRITFLINEDGARLELEDRTSSVTFARVELDVHQLALLLSRRACMPCHIELNGLHKVGKKMVLGTLEFEMPPHDYDNQKEVAAKEARLVCPEGWEPDTYFGSQTSFFRKDGKEHARTTIRRWE